MNIIAYIFAKTVSMFLFAVTICMFGRAIRSWFAGDETTVDRFLYTITEPFVFPFRRILERSELAASSPIDIAFFIAMMVVYLAFSILNIIWNIIA